MGWKSPRDFAPESAKIGRNAAAILSENLGVNKDKIGNLSANPGQALRERGITEVFPDRETADLGQYLAAAPRRIKLGIDPTRPDLHLGHTVALRKLRQFQDAGHKAVLIVGNFTARIGDPTGKSEARPRLSPEEVAFNAQTYLTQAGKVLDLCPDRLEVRYNGDWLDNLPLDQALALLATATVGQMLAKEGFADRYEKGVPVYLHEFFYPLLQGYDSVAIAADVELGGTDQKFNILMGRDLQLHFGQSPQFGMLLPLLPGLDGVQKMSKSLGNYVGLTEDPLTMYSKLEKVPDAVVPTYFELLTDLDLAALPANPRDRQKLLAETLVTEYHGAAAAQQARQDAEALVLSGQTEALGEIPEVSLEPMAFPAPFFYVVKASGLCKSNSEAQSQIANGAVYLNGVKQTAGDRLLSAQDLAGAVLRVGKKKFCRFVP
ncbi:MAG TPA: tyrosine--tRNA ligase [Cyanobacteria bacterium UBA8156]|jgi:tyrosyl-tRNA synthetase|nr:tyrosine--tRNA ligase [Cyanobacteria bacterium UBA8156]